MDFILSSFANAKFRAIIAEAKNNHDSIMTNHDTIMTNHDSIMTNHDSIMTND